MPEPEEWVKEALRGAGLLNTSSRTIGEMKKLLAFPSFTELKQVFAQLRRGEKGLEVEFDVRVQTIRLGGLAEDGESIRLIYEAQTTTHRVTPLTLTIGTGAQGDFTFVGLERWSFDSGYRSSSGVITHTVIRNGGRLSYSAVAA